MFGCSGDFALGPLINSIALPVLKSTPCMHYTA